MRVKFTLVSAAIFKRFTISFLLCMLMQIPVRAQETPDLPAARDTFSITDTFKHPYDFHYYWRKGVLEDHLMNELNFLSASVNADTAAYRDTIPKDTLVPLKFIGYDANIYRNSKANIRKSLLASNNPPLRKHMNNWFVLAWCFVIMLIIIGFKYIYPLQYYLINRAWYSSLWFREFYDTQTDIFKISKLYAWFIISQIFAVGVFVLVRVSFPAINYSDVALAAVISGMICSIFILNQWFKSIFAYAFQQISLSKDYAIIFRVNAYLVALLLLPVILFVYFTNQPVIQESIGLIMLVSLLAIYGFSLIKFSFSGLFAETQSSIFLILYLCAFEVLPILVLVKTFNSFLF